jgi:hypothetical protein
VKAVDQYHRARPSWVAHIEAKLNEYDALKQLSNANDSIRQLAGLPALLINRLWALCVYTSRRAAGGKPEHVAQYANIMGWYDDTMSILCTASMMPAREPVLDQDDIKTPVHMIWEGDLVVTWESVDRKLKTHSRDSQSTGSGADYEVEKTTASTWLNYTLARLICWQLLAIHRSVCHARNVARAFN